MIPAPPPGVDDRPIHHDAALAERVVGERVRGGEGACWLGVGVRAQVVDVVVAPDADAADAVRAQTGRGSPGVSVRMLRMLRVVGSSRMSSPSNVDT